MYRPIGKRVRTVVTMGSGDALSPVGRSESSTEGGSCLATCPWNMTPPSRARNVATSTSGASLSCVRLASKPAMFSGEGSSGISAHAGKSSTSTSRPASSFGMGKSSTFVCSAPSYCQSFTWMCAF
jgi:hypothetical protein